MSIYKVDPGDIETFSVVTNPIRHFVSSSTQGATGSVYVFARRSDLEKDQAPVSSFVDTLHSDVDISTALSSLQALGRVVQQTPVNSLSASFSSAVSKYMDSVASLAVSSRKYHFLDVTRFTPSVTFTENTVKKQIVKDQLSAYYRTVYPSAHWAFVNYNSLNFFTSSTVPTASVLLYPNISGGPVHDSFVTGVYVPSGAFSFDFYINPRYKSDPSPAPFRAGTLLHLSSCFALSLVSGSQKDENGRTVGFRLQLQLSHSADVPPSQVVAQTNNSSSVPSWASGSLVFLSNDNALKWNNWHHVVVRWGTNTLNAGTGTFNVDGIDRGSFVVPSSTIAPKLYSAGGLSGPDVLSVGNFYEGKNTGNNSVSLFFAADPATRDGVQQINASTNIETPLSYGFNHPLTAEVHDLAIKRYYMSDTDIEASASVGPKSLDASIALYVPPFFVESSSFRRFVGTHGGVLQTPFFEIDATTNDPFNVAMSFGVNGHYINVENYLKDFASLVFPRAINLSASAITTTTQARAANDFLYDQQSVRKRNLLVLPCDDGLFVPGFELLASESMQSTTVDDLGNQDLGFVNMNAMISTASLLFGTTFTAPTLSGINRLGTSSVGLSVDVDTSDTKENSFTNELIGFTPEQPGVASGSAYQSYARSVKAEAASGTFDPGVQDNAPLPIFQRTRDPSSNQVTFFNVSNLFYGKRILPGSVVLKDTSFTGSGGAISITLKDDERGGIYRADCLTTASTWNAVGTVFYDEGVIAIKNPHLYFFGKEGFDLSFRGEQNVHVMRINVLAPANQMNSSSNPNFKAVLPSPFPNDPEKEFVYITGINFHDENMNVVAKTQLAQPIIKRTGDRIAFRIKVDF